MNKKYKHMISHRAFHSKKIHALFFASKVKAYISIHQHIAIVLRQYESSYESFVEWLEVATEIVIQL